MLTRKEYDLLLMIHEAEERMERITFVDNQEEIEAFRKKYKTEFELLRDKWYVIGGIDKYCELCMTERGIQALQEYRNISFKNEGIKWNKNAVMWAVITAIVTAIGIIIGFMYS
jgi:hypothetical protein